MDKNNLFTIIIGAVVILIIAVVINLTTKNNIDLNRLNNMYQDIYKLEDAIDIYYLNNGILPVANLVDGVDFKNINPNDGEEYYDIDLSKITNIKLYYGERKDGEDDRYIINERSHTVYYLKGIKFKKMMIYSPLKDYKLINLEKYQ